MAPESRVLVDTVSAGADESLATTWCTWSHSIEFMCTKGSYLPVFCSLGSSAESSEVMDEGYTI